MKKTNIMTAGRITTWHTEDEEFEVVNESLYVRRSQLMVITAKRLCLEREAKIDMNSVLEEHGYHFINKDPQRLKVMVFPVLTNGCESCSL